MGRLIVAALLLIGIAGPVFAQRALDDDPLVLEEKQKKLEAESLDRQYKSTLRNTDKVVAPVRNDPWATMRGSDDGKAKR